MGLGEHSGLHGACARRCSTCPLRVLMRPLTPEGPCPRFSLGMRASPARCSFNLYSRVKTCTGRGAGAGLRLARGRR